MNRTCEWDRALNLIEVETRSDQLESRVIRVEARRDGSQVWALLGDQGPLWFHYHGGKLRRVWPWEDKKLPGADEWLRGDILAWRPGRRAVVMAPDGRSVSKLFRSKRWKDAVQRHELARAGCARGGRWRVPAILEVDGAAARVQFERAHGVELPVLGRHSTQWRSVGAGLAEFQSGVDARDLPRHGRREEMQVVSDMHQRYATLFGSRLPGVSRLMERLESWVSRGTSGSLVAAHRDLHDGQFLYGEEGITVLDFDQLCAGEPELDLANLSTHFVLRQLQGAEAMGDRDAQECALALLAGHGIDGGDESYSALRFYQSATFLRLAILYSMRPRWRRLRKTLLAHAEVSLDELCHA